MCLSKLIEFPPRCPASKPRSSASPSPCSVPLSAPQTAQSHALSWLFPLCLQPWSSWHVGHHSPHRSAVSGDCRASPRCPSSGPFKPQRSSTKEAKGEGSVPAWCFLHPLLLCVVLTGLGLVGWVFNAELCCNWKLSIHRESWFLPSYNSHGISSLSDYLPTVQASKD